MAQFFANDDIVALQDTLIPTPGETVFSARINNNGTATIGTQNVDFIASVSRAGQGAVDIVFQTDFFSVVPTITATELSSGPTICSVSSLTATGCRINNFNRGTGSIDSNFTINAQFQGADYTAARAETTRLGDL